MKTGRNVTLRVSFAAEQLSNRLVWVFDERSAAPLLSPFGPKGRHAGAVHLEQGDLISFEVVGHGPAEFVDFAIADCTLISMPAPYLQKPPQPSPFAPAGQFPTATRRLAFTVAEPTPGPGADDVNSFVAQGKETLTVAEDIGVWELSMVVTVAITWKSKADKEWRVFRFDPESEVGLGISR